MFDKALKKLRQAIKGKDSISYDKFIELSRLNYDKENFRYYLEFIPAKDGGDHYHGNRFFELSGEVVWQAEKSNTLLRLLQEIINQVEWERPSFYNLGLHREEIERRKRY